MIIHTCEQGSGDWYDLRTGIPTASEFKRIITPTGKPAKNDTMRAYAYKLIAEKLLGRSLDSLEGLQWIDHGRENEADAVKNYEFLNNIKTELVGFVTSDDGMIGASPDRLVGTDGLLEIKCPAPQTQIAYLAEGFGDDYMPQVQGQIMVCERQWCDRYAYHPELPPVLVHTSRDEGYISLLSAALDAFNAIRLELLDKISKQGFFVERKKVLLPQDNELEILIAKGD